MASNYILKKIKYMLKFLPDKTYIKLYYWIRMHKRINLNNPTTFNEKLNWLKLNDHNSLYTKLVDKYLVKDYVASIIGREYIIPTIGVWDSVDKIDFEKLPNSFVLKCNHDSEGIIICKDKTKFDFKKAKRKMKKCLKSDFFYIGREWPYKNIKKNVIAEPFLKDKKTGELRDYKFFCFNGEVKQLFVVSGRQQNNTCFDFFDDNFNRLNIQQHYPNSKLDVHELKPINFDLMKSLASKLSAGLKEVRIDFYEVDGKVYFGEFTFFHFSGFMPFIPNDNDFLLGNYIELEK